MVHEADLDEEVEIAGRAVSTATWNGGFRPEGLWRIKGVRQLERSRMPVLTALWHWRDEIARQADRYFPEGFDREPPIALDELPLEHRSTPRGIARTYATTPDELATINPAWSARAVRRDSALPAGLVVWRHEKHGAVAEQFQLPCELVAVHEDERPRPPRPHQALTVDVELETAAGDLRA